MIKMFELPAQSNSSIFIHFSLRMRNEMKRLIEFEGLRPKRMNEQQENKFIYLIGAVSFLAEGLMELGLVCVCEFG